MTVGGIIGGGFRLVRERIAAMAIWALLYAVMNAAVFLAMRPFMANIMAVQAARGAGAAPDPAAMLSGMGSMFGLYLLLMLGLLVLYTAALRSAVHPERRAFAYLRLGMDELRMLGVAVILMVAFVILYIVLVMVAALVGGAVGFLAHDAILPVTVLLMIAVIATLIFFEVRFSLVFALTLLRGKIVIGESWTSTRGRFWTLFGAYFVLLLIVFASAMALFAVTAGPYFAEVAHSGLNPVALQAAQQHRMAQQFGAITVLSVIGWIFGAVLGTFWMTLGAGVAGSAIAALRDESFADIAAIYE